VDLRERVVDTPRHPWEVSRARTFRRLIRRHLDRLGSDPATVLDVGSGDSWFATQLVADLPSDVRVTCWDANYSVEDLVAPLDRRLHRTTEAPSGPYELVVALDVFEHVEDDVAFVRDEVTPRLAPGGLLVASVPAHQALSTRHDEALGHFRRHSAASLRALLAPPLRILSEGSLFSSLLAPRALQKALEVARRPDGPAEDVESQWRHGALLTRVVSGVLDADAALGLALADRRWRPPGLSVWAVCTR
jgi:hypothetical protein